MIKNKEIHIVCKTHFDIGFTDLSAEIIKRYKNEMLFDVIKTCKNTNTLKEQHQFVWTMSSWPLCKSLEQTDQKVIKEAEDLIEKGQIDWHALPYTTHTEFCGLEEFIRGLKFSGDLSKKYDRWPISAKMTDVPGHTYVLPSILHKAGIKFLHLGCNPGCTPPDVPRLFYWEGPDGNRVLTFYNKGAYGSSLTPPKDWKYPIWMALLQTGDNNGPQDEKFIQSMVDDLGEKLPDSAVFVGSMDNFYLALEPYLDDDIPVVKGDLADSWIHGVGSYPKAVSTIRSLRQKLTSVETLISLASMQGVLPKEKCLEYKKRLDSCYEDSILFGEHTWGLDVKTTMGYGRRFDKKGFMESKQDPIYKKMELSWQEQRDRVANTESTLEEIYKDLVTTISSAFSGEDDIVVFNLLSFERSGWIDVSDYVDGNEDVALVDAKSGETIAVESKDNKFMAYVKDITSLGYKAFNVAKKQVFDTKNELNVDIELGVLENKRYKIVVSKETGAITSLFDKQNDKEWVNSDDSKGFASYQYDIYDNQDITDFIKSYTYRFYDWLVNDLGRMDYPSCEHQTFLYNNFSVSSEMGSGYASLVLSKKVQGESVLEYGNAKEISIKITVYEYSDFIDFDVLLDGKQETPYVESGHFILPLNLNNAKLNINKLGSVIDPEKDIVKDANNLLYCCENWLSLSDSKDSMAIIPIDAPLFSRGEMGIYKYSSVYRASKNEHDGTLYFNLFNNSWGTNFPQWMGGDYCFRYRLMPFKGDTDKSTVQKLAIESMTPLLSNVNSCNKADKQFESNTIVISDNASLVTIKLSEDECGYIVRLREIAGENGVIRISLGEKANEVAVCDLFERKDEVLVENDDSLEIQTVPFEIHTLYVKR